MSRLNTPNILRYDLIDRPGVLGNYVPLNYHCLYDLSVLVAGFWLSLEHPKVCIICGAVETASSTQKCRAISCPEYTPNWYQSLHEATLALYLVTRPSRFFILVFTFCSSFGLGNGGGPLDAPWWPTITYKIKKNRRVASLDIMPKMPHANFGINRVYTQGRRLPAIKHKCYMVFIY